VNYAKLLEMNSFFTLHSFLEVGKTQDLPSKFWQTLGDALRSIKCGLLTKSILQPYLNFQDESNKPKYAMIRQCYDTITNL
jgi:hypothetical protein